MHDKKMKNGLTDRRSHHAQTHIATYNHARSTSVLYASSGILVGGGITRLDIQQSGAIAV